MSRSAIFEAGQEEVYFRRLRDEAPLHYCQDSPLGLIGQ